MIHNLNKIHAICFLLIFNTHMRTHAEVFTATSEMENLLAPENVTIYELESYIRMQEKKLNVLKR